MDYTTSSNGGDLPPQGERVDKTTPTQEKKKKKGMPTSTTRFLGVRQRPSGRWVAEIKVSSQKLRLWLGTFDKPEEAAMAYDFAARLLRGRNAKTNFPLIHEATKMPSKNPRSYQLLHYEGLGSCVDKTIFCSSDSKREGFSGFSLGGSRVYSSVVVAPSFGDGFCPLEEEKRCEDVMLDMAC